MTAEAVASASATGLPRTVVTSTLSALERARLVARSSDRSQPEPRVEADKASEQKVLEALPMANKVAEDLYIDLKTRTSCACYPYCPSCAAAHGNPRAL